MHYLSFCTSFNNMHYSQHHCHGGDAWSPQTFGQMAFPHGKSIAWTFSDVPGANGQLSDALTHKLAEEDLTDMAVLLRYRGIRTLRALEGLEAQERAVLLSKSREFYEILGIFPSNLKNTLNMLFGDVPLQGTFHSGSRAMHSPWAGRADWMRGLSSGSMFEAPEPLTEPLDDDTYLKRALGASLRGARDVVGWERYSRCLQRLRRSRELAVASSEEAAEALNAIDIPKEDVRDRDRWEAVKAAKKAVRDVLLWLCAGNALGLDSREAMVRAFQQAVRHMHGDTKNLISQLTNGYRRIRQELAGGPAPRNRIATSPARRTQEASGSRGRSIGPQQAEGTASENGCDAAAGAVAAAVVVGAHGIADNQSGAEVGLRIVPALFDPMGPSPSDPVLPHPADASDLHEQGSVLAQSSIRLPPGLESSMSQGETRKEHRSLPPTRRSPGARSRDPANSLQMAQIMEMMKGVTRELQEVKTQMSKLQQIRHPFPLHSVIPFGTDDENYNCASTRGRVASAQASAGSRSYPAYPLHLYNDDDDDDDDDDHDDHPEQL